MMVFNLGKYLFVGQLLYMAVFCLYYVLLYYLFLFFYIFFFTIIVYILTLELFARAGIHCIYDNGSPI